MSSDKGVRSIGVGTFDVLDELLFPVRGSESRLHVDALCAVSLVSRWTDGLQKCRTVKMLLRLPGSLPKLRLHQLQFTISRIVTGVKVGRLATLQM